ncbi:MAG: hypothetical protein V3S86_02840 [Nitrosomonadaceae bacterium]
MADKLLLFLGAEWLSVYSWSRGRLQGGQPFSNDESGHDAFADLLDKHPKVPCYLLADLVEEDFRSESIPHVSGRDRKDIVLRKFEQFYHNTPFRHAHTLYREQDGRRDDMTLFSALTNPELVSPWLDIMLEHEASVAGIYSVPLISHQLVSHISSSHLLLVTWQKYSGLREIFYRDGNISFSRLTPLVRTDVRTEDITKPLQTELNRTYKYLSSLSLLPIDQALDVCIICSKDHKKELQETLQDSDNVCYLIEDIDVLAERIGLREIPTDSDATSLLLHMLGRKPPANQYAIADDMHFHNLWKAQSLLKITVATVAFICVVWSGINLWEASNFHQDKEAVNAMKVSIVAQERQIEANYPHFPVSVDRMKAGVSVIQNLSASALQPQQFLAEISRRLEDFPMIQVNSLSWRVTSGLNAVQGNGYPITKASLSTAYQEILLGGEVISSLNLRDTIDSIHQFGHALDRAGFSATPVTMPINLDSGASIAGDLDSEKKLRGSAFVMRVVLNSQAQTESY